LRFTFPRDTVLVTGGAGYIGGHAVLALLEANHPVVIVDNLSRGFSETIETLKAEAVKRGNGDLVQFHDVDLGDRVALSAVFKKHRPWAVMHFAGVAYAGESVDNPTMYYRNNTGNTLNVLDAMTEHGVEHIVFSSSCATYGSPQMFPVTEETPQEPISPYGWSKFMAEREVKDWLVSSNMQKSTRPGKAVILRYFNVIGADPLSRVGERVYQKPGTYEYRKNVRLSSAMFDAAEGLLEKFTVAGGRYETPDGSAVRDYIHVTDLVNAHVAVLHRFGEEPSLRIYNVGSGKPYSVKEMIAAAKTVTSSDFHVLEGKARDGDPAQVFADNTKIRTELGWTPKFLNLTETLGHQWAFRKKIRSEKPLVVEMLDVSRLNLESVEVFDEYGSSLASVTR